MGCGGQLTGINGSLTSPNYPGNYTERISCRWTITVPSRRVVTITFTDLNIIGTGDCNRGYVEVFNGINDSSPSFGRYCGNVSLLFIYVIYFIFEWNLRQFLFCLSVRKKYLLPCNCVCLYQKNFSHCNTVRAIKNVFDIFMSFLYTTIDNLSVINLKRHIT